MCNLASYSTITNNELLEIKTLRGLSPQNERPPLVGEVSANFGE
jgi:hypothetical protein